MRFLVRDEQGELATILALLSWTRFKWCSNGCDSSKLALCENCQLHLNHALTRNMEEENARSPQRLA
jgi:hypothetical protein